MIKLATKYKEYKLVDVSKEGLNFDDKDREECKKDKEELNSKHKIVKEYLKTVLPAKVQHVKMTLLLSDYPVPLCRPLMV